MSPMVQADALDKQSLALVNAYNPGLSGAWMLQRAMSVRPGEKPNPNFINQVRMTHPSYGDSTAAGKLPVCSNSSSRLPAAGRPLSLHGR